MAAPPPSPRPPDTPPVHSDPTGAAPPPVSPDPPPVAPDPAPVAPAATPAGRLMLPPHRNKIERVQDHFEGAIGALREWIELRIALTKREIEETIDARRHQAEVLGKAWGVTAVLGLAAALMALFFLGYLFSALWGLVILSILWSLTLGYLTLVILLGLGAFVAMRRARAAQSRLATGGDRLPHPPPKV